MTLKRMTLLQEMLAFIGLSGLGTWGPRFFGALVLFGGLIFFFAPRYAGRPLIKPISFRVPANNGPSSQPINPAVPPARHAT